MQNFYIYSSLTSDVKYTFWKKGGTDLQVRDRTIRINGGANVVNKKELMTPRGAVTVVTNDELELLKTHPIFQLHVDNGFIKYEAKEIPIDRAVSDLEKKDKSAQKTPSDYPDEKRPVLNTPKKK